MGAILITKTFKTIDETEIEKRFKKLVKDCKKEFGNDPYNGTFSTMSGLCITNKIFYDEDSAENYIATHAEKWGDALAVTVEPDDKKSYTLVGGWAAE